jgi:uncharacterized membrane protein YkoI
MKRLFAIALLMIAAPAAATAQRYPEEGRPVYGPGGGGDQDAARAAVRGGRQVPLSQVIAMISARTPGRQLNTTQGEHQGRAAYFVQWQTNDGRVIIFIVDAQSGAILSRQGG